MSVKGVVVVMTFSVMAWKSLGLKWTTEALHTNCCEGQDKILMWNCSLEKNETVQNIQWYFNHSTQIAYVSGSGKFYVHDLYKSRVEQIGKMGILLKNVSSVDTGNYGIHLNLGPEPPENMQTIFLTVFESPTYQCKPSITKYPENVLFCSTNSCGGTQLPTEWRISEKYEFVSNASYLKINSSWNAEHVSCCLHRQNVQCQNGNLLDFCTWTFAEDKHVPDSKNTENSMNLTPAVIVLATIIFLFVVTVIICFSYRNKIRRLSAKRRKGTDKKQESKNKCEVRPMMRGAMQHDDSSMERKPNMELEAHAMMRGAMQLKVTHIELEHKNECEDRPKMEGAMQHDDSSMERKPNMELEAHAMMRGAMQLKVTHIELEHKNECEDRPKMEGAMQHDDSSMERKPNMELEAHAMMRGAMQLKVTHIELENKNECEDRPKMEGAMQHDDSSMERKPNMELEAHAMMRGAMQLKVTHIELEHKNECEDRPKMEGAMQHDDSSMERKPNMELEAHAMMRGAMQLKVTHIELEHKNECEDRPKMEGAMQHNDTNMEREPNMELEAHPVIRGMSTDSETSRKTHYSDACSHRSEDSLN